MSLDPVTLAVLQGRLEQIADEMDATLFRAAFNPIIAEAHDASHGLYDAVTGDTLVQGKQGLPVFVGAMAFAVRAVIDRHTRAGTSPVDGDVHIFNDPYDGGTHLSDFKLVRPYFREGRLFCWLASVGHWHDVGGAVPGNYNPAATECFQEGMLIPPVKLVDAGRFNGDILAILQANSRLPGSLYGDLQGQLGALDLGVARLDALLDQYGVDTLRTAFTALRERAALLMRDCIADLPDGVETVEDYLDNDGITDARLTVRLTVKVVSDQLTLDFTGSSPACAGPVNIARSTAIAACYVALKHLFPDVPANAGVLDPVRIIVPEGSFLAVTAPKPVGGYTETILRVIDAVFVALSRFAPTRATACAYGTINALSLSGHRADGQRWVMFCFFGGGHGGHPMGDGLNHGNAPISMATIPPLEILEAAYPVITTAWALRPDSGGAGQHRGGLGAIYEFELLADQADLFLFGERARVQPPGVLGGEPGAANRFHWTSDGVGHEPALGAKVVGAKLKRGDRVRLATPGGGGFGPAEARDPAATLKDLALGYVTEAV